MGFKKNISKIEVLQKKCVRIMTFAPFNSHTNQIFINLKLLKVKDLISISHLRLVYNFLNERLPTDLMNLFVLRSDVDTTSREMRSKVNRLIYMPSFKTITYGKDSIRYRCAQLWNATFKTGVLNVDNVLKVSLDNITTVKVLTTLLKKYFLYSYTAQPPIDYL